MSHVHAALRPYALAVLLALTAAAVAVAVSVAYGVPLRDPDGIAGPAYVRLPGAVLVLVLMDVVPRAIRRRCNPWTVLRERYGPQRIALVVVGLLAFWVSYLAYRNLKGALPLARPDVHDAALLEIDRDMFFGVDPAVILHTTLGTGVAAYVLSAVYVVFLAFVPASLAVALVWSRTVFVSCWYVTALCLNWLLGTVSYYLIPSLGPIFVRPDLYAGLPDTGVAGLQASLAATRAAVVIDPAAADALAGVAGFASLHVSITFTAALIAQRIRLPRVLRWVLWAFFATTVVATLYFGWHYLVDDLAGVALGAGAVAIGHRATRRGLTAVEEPVPASAHTLAPSVAT